MEVMRRYGVSEKIVRIVMSLYENTRAQVRVKRKLSEYLSLRTGLKQGCSRLCCSTYLLIGSHAERWTPSERVALRFDSRDDEKG